MFFALPLCHSFVSSMSPFCLFASLSMQTSERTKITAIRTHWSWCWCCCCFFSLPFVMPACWFRSVVEIIFFVVCCSFTCKNPYSDRLDIYSNEGAAMLQTHLMLINVSCCCFFLILLLRRRRRLCCYCRRFKAREKDRVCDSLKDCCCCCYYFSASDALPTCISMLTMMTTTMMMLMMVCIYMRLIRQCQTKKPCTSTHNIIIFQILFCCGDGVTYCVVLFCLWLCHSINSQIA